MCKVFKVSRSGYYNWLKSKPSRRSLENQSLLEKIRVIHQESKQRYGSPKITMILNKDIRQASRVRIARIMRKAQIRSKIKERFKVTTNSKHTFPVCDNILNRDFKAHDLGEKWVSDITYIATKEGWLYLTVIIDLSDRKVIGWSVSESMAAKNTVITALKKAVSNRVAKPGLIFHSDRGVQYACEEFRTILNRITQVNQSMSRKGNCWDNAVAESFFKIVKSELGYGIKFETKQQASLVLFEFIEGWYNRRRIHQALGYKTPIQAEKERLNKNQLAA
jgi:putative transposase